MVGPIEASKLLWRLAYGVSNSPFTPFDYVLNCDRLSWCLPTGFHTPITYFYLGFFVVLLLHRQMRDDEACKEKYGKDWDRYCKLVPYKIIPYVVSPGSPVRVLLLTSGSINERAPTTGQNRRRNGACSE